MLHRLLITFGVMVLILIVVFCMFVAAIGGKDKVDRESAGKWYYLFRIAQIIGNGISYIVLFGGIFAGIYALIWC